MRYAILQTCVPYYRIGLFDDISSQLGEDFAVVAGDAFYDPSLTTATDGREWYRPCRNDFFLRRKVLVQSGIGLLDHAKAVVVEANPRCVTTWKFLAAARKRGIRTAAWGHAFGRGATKMATARRAMFSLASEIICYGHDELAPLQNVFPDKRIRVAGNTVLRAAECAPLTTPRSDRRDVLLLGRLVSAKKGLLLLKAFEILRTKVTKFGLVVIGDGPDRAAMEKQVASAGLENIRFVGELRTLPEIRDHAAKAFCMVSAGYAGLSLLHAQSMGLPFIYSPGEPNAPEIEIARDGWNCLAFKSDDPSDLADRICQMHAAEWLEKSDAYCDLVRNRYSIESMSRQFVNFFRDVNI